MDALDIQLCLWATKLHKLGKSEFNFRNGYQNLLPSTLSSSRYPLSQLFVGLLKLLQKLWRRESKTFKRVHDNESLVIWAMILVSGTPWSKNVGSLQIRKLEDTALLFRVWCFNYVIIVAYDIRDAPLAF